MASDQANDIAAALDRLWERFLPEIRTRVAILEAAAQALENGELVTAQREEASSAAHKLAGTLGTFGLARGTAVARELEQQFASGAGPSAESAARSATELRELIERRSSSTAN